MSEATQWLFPFRRWIGRDDWPATASDSMSEHTRWIGRPWRRVELLTHVLHWKGETEVADRTLSLHLGSRRLGLFLTVSLTRQSGYDYSEERL